MKMNPNARVRELEAEIAELEARLQSALRPVEPRPGFVRGLQHQLLYHPEEIEVERRFTPANVMVIAASLVGGAALVIFGARGLRSLRQALGRLQKEEVAVPANLA
jgi:nucleotide-binding universal stress UspA family protein